MEGMTRNVQRCWEGRQRGRGDLPNLLIAGGGKKPINERGCIKERRF